MSSLFILRQSPYRGSLAREALDMALAFAAFDEDVQLLFMGDSVFQLLGDQDSSGIAIKNIAKSLAALEIYEIEQVFVAADCLNLRGIKADDLKVRAQAVDNLAIQTLITNAKKVLHL